MSLDPRTLEAKKLFEEKKYKETMNLAGDLTGMDIDIKVNACISGLSALCLFDSPLHNNVNEIFLNGIKLACDNSDTIEDIFEIQKTVASVYSEWVHDTKLLCISQIITNPSPARWKSYYEQSVKYLELEMLFSSAIRRCPICENFRKENGITSVDEYVKKYEQPITGLTKDEENSYFYTAACAIFEYEKKYISENAHGSGNFIIQMLESSYGKFQTVELILDNLLEVKEPIPEEKLKWLNTHEEVLSYMLNTKVFPNGRPTNIFQPGEFTSELQRKLSKTRDAIQNHAAYEDYYYNTKRNAEDLVKTIIAAKENPSPAPSIDDYAKEQKAWEENSKDIISAKEAAIKDAKEKNEKEAVEYRELISQKKEHYTKILSGLNEEIETLTKERSKLGMFSFGAKKDLDQKIASANTELQNITNEYSAVLGESSFYNDPADAIRTKLPEIIKKIEAEYPLPKSPMDAFNAEKHWYETKMDYKSVGKPYGSREEVEFYIYYCVMTIAECANALSQSQYTELIHKCFDFEPSDQRVGAYMRRLMDRGFLTRKSVGDNLFLYSKNSSAYSFSKSQSTDSIISNPIETRVFEENKPTLYDIILSEVPSSAKISVIKMIREFANVDLNKAKKMVDTPNSLIQNQVPEKDAMEIKNKLEALGATVILK